MNGITLNYNPYLPVPFNPAKTITPSGVTGPQTINTPAGSVNFAPNTISLVVTNSLVVNSDSSRVNCTLNSQDPTAVLDSVLIGSGNFTIRMSVAPTNETIVSFLVF